LTTYRLFARPIAVCLALPAFTIGRDDEILGNSTASGDPIGPSTDELSHSGAAVAATNDDEIA